MNFEDFFEALLELFTTIGLKVLYAILILFVGLKLIKWLKKNLPTVVSQLLAENKARVRVLESHDKWYGVTYKEDKPGVVEAMARMRKEGLYPEKLWEE